MDKLLLIDGNSIMNRAFYGLPLLTDSKGRFTNAVFGFINILLRTIDTEKPSHIMIAFDSKAPTFRHLEYKEYKGNRKGMPDELRTQMPLVKEVLATMGIGIYEQDGIEADDILGTMSLNFEDKGSVTVLSGDRDLLQLASDKTKISIPRTKGGQTTTEHYHFKDFVDAYGFTPSQFIDVKGMMGDSSDNIPGIPGVGEKTAHKFIIKYQSLEGLYEHVDELPGKTKIKVAENKDMAYLSRDLATIKRDCDIPVELDSLQIGDYLNEDTFHFFKELNFTRLLSRFDFNKIEDATSARELDFTRYDTFDAFLKEGLTLAEGRTMAFFDYREEGYIAFSMQVKKGKKEHRLVFEPEQVGGLIPYEDGLTDLFSVAEKVLFYDYKAFLHRYDFDMDKLPKSMDDLHLMYYLAKPNKGDYPLLDLGLNYTDITLHDLDELLGKGKKRVPFATLKEEDRLNYLVQSVTIIHDSYKPVADVLLDDNMLGLYNTMEKPLLEVLYDMEREGIHVDTKVLIDLSEGLEKEIVTLESNIFEMPERSSISNPQAAWTYPVRCHGPSGDQKDQNRLFHQSRGAG